MHLIPCLAYVPVLIFTMEVSVVGIISNTKDSTQAANQPDIPQSLLSAMSMSTIINSFEFKIYVSRNAVTQPGPLYRIN